MNTKNIVLLPTFCSFHMPMRWTMVLLVPSSRLHSTAFLRETQQILARALSIARSLAMVVSGSEAFSPPARPTDEIRWRLGTE